MHHGSIDDATCYHEIFDAEKAEETHLSRSSRLRMAVSCISLVSLTLVAGLVFTLSTADASRSGSTSSIGSSTISSSGATRTKVGAAITSASSGPVACLKARRGGEIQARRGSNDNMVLAKLRKNCVGHSRSLTRNTGSYSNGGNGRRQRVSCHAEAGTNDQAGSNDKRVVQDVLCCPVTFQDLRPSASLDCVECQESGLKYGFVDDIFIDLTPASGKLISPSTTTGSVEAKPKSPLPFDVLDVADTIQKATQGRIRPTELFKDGYGGDNAGVGVTTFQSPLVSQVYEQGWRQSFARAGFPGPDKEFQIAQKWLLPVARDGTLVDASCGSGLFTRRFVSSDAYKQIIALDFSESMLSQTAALCKQNNVWNGGPALATSPLLVRGDIGRMPFKSGSIDGLHAGAAIHCWPAPSLALAEIARVLKPGGRAVLSTFMNPQLPFTDERLRKAIFGPLTQNSQIRSWEEGELRGLSESVGLVDFECERNREFIIFKVEKPASRKPLTPLVTTFVNGTETDAN